MKLAIFVCILVVLAYHEVVCTSPPHYPVLIDGDCKPEELPRDIRDGCNKVRCTKDAKGGLSFSAVTCSLSTCPDGTELGGGPHDLTKRYPECCFPNTCN